MTNDKGENPHDSPKSPPADATEKRESPDAEVPWLLQRGFFSGDKRMDRLGIDTENSTTLEIWIELKRRIAQIEEEKKRRKTEIE